MSPGAYDDLDELITWVATAPQAQFTGEIDARIDRRDYEDWWIFVTLIMGDDSAGKNAYHYHDPVSGGPWRYAPWDFNDSFGQTWQTARKGFDAHPEDYVWANELFARMLLDPGLGPPLRARYGAALTDVYAVDRVLDRVDELALEVVKTAPTATSCCGRRSTRPTAAGTGAPTSSTTTRRCNTSGSGSPTAGRSSTASTDRASFHVATGANTA